MFTETQHQSLVHECRQWREELVSWRERLQELKKELYYYAPGKTDHDVAMGIEHFHNQLHLQLINIHDLKYEIKRHLAEAERHPTFGHRIPHHYIQEKLDMLLSDLNNLDNEFHTFIKNNP
jgi:hypothetical protein